MVRPPSLNDFQSDTEYKDAMIEYLQDQVTRLNLAIEALAVGCYPMIGIETINLINEHLGGKGE